MSTPDHAATPDSDPLRDLALQIYIELAGRIYSDTTGPADRQRPQPQALAQMSFKLAEVFLATDQKVNPKAIAKRAASDKAGVNVSEMVMDFAKMSAEHR